MNGRSWRVPLGVATAAAGLAVGLPRLADPAGSAAPPAAVAPTVGPASPSAGPAGAPPAWPAESAPPPAGPHDPALRSGLMRTRGVVDPGPGFRTTVPDLAATSPYIAVVTAVGRKSYWSAIGATTATNYRVEHVVKGRLPAYVQVAEFGAPANSFPHSEQAWMPSNEALPEVGRRYVLFLAAALGGGRFETRDGSNSRFEVVDGVVRSIRERFPHANRAILIRPTPLAEFLERLRR